MYVFVCVTTNMAIDILLFVQTLYRQGLREQLVELEKQNGLAKTVHVGLLALQLKPPL